MGMTTILTLTAMFSSVREDILHFLKKKSCFFTVFYLNLFIAAFLLLCVSDCWSKTGIDVKYRATCVLYFPF
jgi:hypothetical protein